MVSKRRSEDLDCDLEARIELLIQGDAPEALIDTLWRQAVAASTT
jgi:hypothetical protein